MDGRSDSTDNVDEDCNEDGGSYGSSIFGVISAPDELLVAVFVDESEDRQDYDGEYRKDETVVGLDHVAPGLRAGDSGAMTNQDQA